MVSSSIQGIYVYTQLIQDSELMTEICLVKLVELTVTLTKLKVNNNFGQTYSYLWVLSICFSIELEIENFYLLKWQP